MTTIPDDIYRLQTSENLAIKQLANAVVAINDSGGGGDGSTPDLSGYATTEDLNTADAFQAMDPTLGTPAPDFLDNVLANINTKIGSGSAPDLSGYATKSGLYKDATTPVDLETTCQGFETAINGMSAPDLSSYATKSGLYKDATTAVDLETQCQNIETRVASLETPAVRMSEQDMDVLAKKAAKEIVENPNYLKMIVKGVTDAITTQKT